jgi:hypothetical protein
MEKNEVIDWWQLVWFPHAIPKLSFILWLVMRNRMITGERLVKWGYKGDVIYIYICRNGLESRYHLFFLNVVSVIVFGSFAFIVAKKIIPLFSGRIFCN